MSAPLEFDLQWLLIGLPVSFALGWMASRFDVRQLKAQVAPPSKKPLLDDLRTALVASPPTWPEVSRLAEHHRSSASELYSVLLKLERDVVTGSDVQLVQSRDAIAGYIVSYQSMEPFSAVPERIRPHLHKLYDSSPKDHDALRALAAEIEDLAEVNRVEKIKERRRAAQGLLLGLLGLLVGFLAFLFPAYGPATVKALGSSQESQAEPAKK